MQFFYAVLFILTTPLFSLSQDIPPVTIVDGSVKIRPMIGRDGQDTVYQISIELQFNTEYNAENTTVKFELDGNHNNLSGDPILLKNEVKIKQEDWKKNATKEYFLKLQLSSLEKKPDSDETGLIIIKEQPKQSLKIILLNNPLDDSYNGDDPYWVEVGTNLDFVDGAKPNNLTAGLFFHLLDHRWGKKGSSKWASFAGAYEAKIVTAEENSTTGTYEFANNNSIIPNNRDQIYAFRYFGQPKVSQTIRNWSFFYSPAYRLSSKTTTFDDHNLHLFVSAWLELRYQEVESKINYGSLVLKDTSLVPIQSISSYPSLSDTLFRNGIFSHYYGVGLPVYYVGTNVIFFLNPVIGATNQPSSTEYSSLAMSAKTDKNTGNPNWRPFYFVQFRLSDTKFGITVTGEIRGLIKKNSPPQYTVALTKKFNLQKLINYNGGK